MTTVYVSIGNSDDKLTQARWSIFVADVRRVIQRHAAQLHGAWFSEPDAPWQNACWCFDAPADAVDVEHMKYLLGDLAEAYEQDSIAWAECPVTEFIPTTGRA